MDAKLEIEVLFKLVESLEKTLIAYNPSKENDYVKGARRIIKDINLSYGDWRNNGLSEVLEKRLARSLREDACHLFYHMFRVFDTAIGWKAVEDCD